MPGNKVNGIAWNESLSARASRSHPVKVGCDAAPHIELRAIAEIPLGGSVVEWPAFVFRCFTDALEAYPCGGNQLLDDFRDFLDRIDPGSGNVIGGQRQSLRIERGIKGAHHISIVGILQTLPPTAAQSQHPVRGGGL